MSYSWKAPAVSDVERPCSTKTKLRWQMPTCQTRLGYNSCFRKESPFQASGLTLQLLIQSTTRCHGQRPNKLLLVSLLNGEEVILSDHLAR